MDLLRHIILIVVFGILLLFAIGSLAILWERMGNINRRMGNLNLVESKKVTLGCELEGVILPYPKQNLRELGILTHLVMSYKGHQDYVKSLGKLRGMVRIETDNHAIQFVRLRTTSLLTDHTGLEEYEILSLEEYQSLPYWYQEVDSLRKQRMKKAQELKLRIVGPIQVEAIETGFRVTRWTYIPKPSCQPPEVVNWQRHDTVQKIAETVARDGTYTRTVLEQRILSEIETP